MIMNVHDTISIYHDEALVKLFIHGECDILNVENAKNGCERDS